MFKQKINNLNFFNLPTYKKINYINFSLAALFLFFISFNQKILPPLIVLWILSFIVEIIFIKKEKTELSKKEIFLLLTPVLFFLSNAIGFFYSDNKTASFLNIQTTLSLFIFPLIFIFSNNLYKKHGKILLTAFVAGNIISAIICLLSAFSDSLKTIDGRVIFDTVVYPEFTLESFFTQINLRVSEFSYMYLSRFMHPSYYAMYLNTVIVILYYFYRQTSNKIVKTFYITGIVFFYSIIYLLASRAGLISLFFLLISLTIIEIRLNKHYILVLLFSFTLGFGLYKAMSQGQIKTNIAQVQQKIEEFKTNEKENPAEINENLTAINKKHAEINKNTAARFIIWECALQAIKDNVVFGVGNGDMRNTMCEKYVENDYNDGLKLKLDPHNQFLATMLSGGIFSLLSLLLMLVWGFLYSIKTRKCIFSFFIAIFSFNILVESMLTTISGVAFFAFFFSFLIVYSPTVFKKIN